MHDIVRAVRDQLSRKRMSGKHKDLQRISLRWSELSWFYLSTSAVCSFTHGGKLFYFRECPPILPRRAYFGRATDRFFLMLNGNGISPEHFKQKLPIRVHFEEAEIAAFRAYLEDRRADDGLFRTLSRAHEISRRMHFSIWNGGPQVYTEDFFRAFGLLELPPVCHDVAVCFLWYMRGVAAAYRTGRLVRSRTHSYFSAVRSVASKIVADAVGLGHMIPETSMCRIELENGDSMLGVLSAAACGSRMADTAPVPDGSLQRELTNLNILDLICFQPDHGPNNYNVYRENGEYRVCAFDNDNPSTFFPFPGIGRNFIGCSSFVNGKGGCNRPYRDGALLSALDSLHIPGLKRELKPWLNPLQTLALVSRLKRVKNMLASAKQETVRAGALEHGGALEDELSGRYGKTYLTIVSERNGNG